MLQTLASSLLLALAPAPPITCEISLEKWCIVELPVMIEMTDERATRTWRIVTDEQTARAEILIYENKFCEGSLGMLTRDETDKRKFNITTEQECGLEIFVSNFDEQIHPEFIINRVIMLKRGDRWLPPMPYEGKASDPG